MRIVVTTDETVARADEVVDFLRGPRLWIPRTDYPDFDDWLQKSWVQLRRIRACGNILRLTGIGFYRHPTFTD